MAKMKKDNIALHTLDEKWQDMTPGCTITGNGTSKLFRTGDWRVSKPVFIADKCKQCLLCAPVCPDSSIPVKNGKRLDFDYEHCKGCGICAVNCPFGAIEMKEGE
jgi:pyruvate ferredoxin oxidoreductase delta subunit